MTHLTQLEEPAQDAGRADACAGSAEISRRDQGPEGRKGVPGWGARGAGWTHL